MRLSDTHLSTDTSKAKPSYCVLSASMYPMRDTERFRLFPPNRERLLEYQASGATSDVTRPPSSVDSTYMHLQRNPAPTFRSNVPPHGPDIGPHGDPTYGMQEEPARRNEALLRSSATRPVSAVPRPVPPPPPNHDVSTLPLFPGAELLRNRAGDEPPRTGTSHPLPNILRRSPGSLPPIAAARATLGLGRTSAFHAIGQSKESEDIRPQADVVVTAPDCCVHHEEQLPPPANRPAEQFWDEMRKEFRDEMRKEFQQGMKRFFDGLVESNMNSPSAATCQIRPQPAASIPCGAPSAHVIHHRPIPHAAAPHPYPAGYVEASQPRLQHAQNIMHPPAYIARHGSAPGIINFSTHANEERMRTMTSDLQEAASMPRGSTNINEPAFGQPPQRRAYDLNVAPEAIDTDEPMEYVNAPAPQMPTAALVNDNHTQVHERHIMSPPSHVGAMCRTCPPLPQPQPGPWGHLSHVSHPQQQQLSVFRQPTLNYQLRQPPQQQQPQGIAPPAANRQYEQQRVSLPYWQPQEQSGDIHRQPSAPRQQVQQPQDPHPARVFTPSVIHEMAPTRGALQPQQPHQEQSGTFGPHAHMPSQDQTTLFACRHAHMVPRPQPGPFGGHATPQPREVGGHAPPSEQATPLGGRPPLPWKPRPFRGYPPPQMQAQRIGQHPPPQELQPAGASEGNAPPQEQQPTPFEVHAAPDVLPAWTHSPHTQALVQPGAIILHPEPHVQSGTNVPHGDMMRPQDMIAGHDAAQPEEENLPMVRQSQEEARPGDIIEAPVAPPPEPLVVQPRRKRGRPARPRPPPEQMQPADNINIAAPAAPAAPQPQPIIPVQQQNVIDQNVLVNHGTGDPTVEEAHVIVVGRVGGAEDEGGGDGAPILDQHVPVRCDPFAPCVNCLAFFGVPAMPPPRGYLRARANGMAHYHDYDDPPLLDNAAQLPVQRRRQSRHGPKSQSSEFRGVTFYKRTGRWEAHIWYVQLPICFVSRFFFLHVSLLEFCLFHANLLIVDCSMLASRLLVFSCQPCNCRLFHVRFWIAGCFMSTLWV